MKRGDKFIIGVDLETGGFDPGRHSILTIGVYWRQTEPHYSTTTKAPEHTLRLLVEREPDTIVEPEAAAKCGWVSDEQWLARGAVPLRNALDIFGMWLTRLAEKLKVRTFEPLAHNHSAVDRPFLEYWSGRYDLRDLFFGEEGMLSHAWHDSMTTLRAAQVAGMVPAGSATLDGLLQAMGRRPRPGAHDALDDARGAFDGYHWLTVLMSGIRPTAVAWTAVESHEAPCWDCGDTGVTKDDEGLPVPCGCWLGREVVADAIRRVPIFPGGPPIMAAPLQGAWLPNNSPAPTAPEPRSETVGSNGESPPLCGGAPGESVLTTGVSSLPREFWLPEHPAHGG